MEKKLMLTLLLIAGFTLTQAQEQTDKYLQEITNVVKKLRKSSQSVYDTAITTLSKDGRPKITLMDEIKWAGDEEEKANEVKGSKGNRFKLNRIVANVYKEQNHQLESKTDMLNGNEKDVHYSIIEKSVKRGGKVTYEINGRSGKQDFVFVSFNPKSKYVVYVYLGKQIIRKEATDVCTIHLDGVLRNQPIIFSITYLDKKGNKNLVESFAIINYNPQK